MLGDFFTRIFVLLLGYAYPAFECYKTVEKNRIDIEELRIWCQYWIIVAFVTVLERFADIFISWLPMYGEMKLAFFIYLWHPKTKGAGYVYQTLLQPVVSKHETDIDRTIMEWRARAWDFTLQHLQNVITIGQTTFFQGLQYLATQTAKVQNRTPESGDAQDSTKVVKPPPTQERVASFKKAPTAPSTPPSTPNAEINRVMFERMKPEIKHFQPGSPKTQTEDAPGSPINDRLNQARLKLRRSKLVN